jgi:hypothetical protein
MAVNILPDPEFVKQYEDDPGAELLIVSFKEIDGSPEVSAGFKVLKNEDAGKRLIEAVVNVAMHTGNPAFAYQFAASLHHIANGIVATADHHLSKKSKDN